MDIPIELCVSARAYRPSTTRRAFLASLIIALYAIVIPFCYFTAGDPRKAAIQNAQKLADERWAAESVFNALNVTVNATEISASSESVFVELASSGDAAITTTTGSITSSSDALVDSSNISNNNNNNPTEAIRVQEDEPEPEPEPEQSWGQFQSVSEIKDFSPKPPKGGFLSSWFGPSPEQKKAKLEFEKWVKQFNEHSPTGPVSLPPSYLPSAWACLAIFATLSFHALFYLMCHWITAFKAAAQFQPATRVEEGTHILVTPPANRGKSAIVLVTKSPLNGGLQMEFQRQKYLYTPSNRLGASAREFPNGVFTLATCPVNLSLSHYAYSAGLQNDSEAEKVLDKWGKNHLAVHTPSFLELLQQQLVSPLAIFQVFCALLWLLDEYWTYTMWSLVSVVIFEAMTVFQRSRTQAMLGGMSPTAAPIYVYRCRKWSLLTTKDLLPGDLISLAFKKRSSAAAPATAANKNNNNTTGTAVTQGNASVPGDGDKKPKSNSGVKSNATSINDIVPCDCLLLRGSAVVNEASLTGESVPQMKESLNPEHGEVNEGDDNDEAGEHGEAKLDMNGIHRVHTLFSGTSIVTIDTEDTETILASVPVAPDGGAVAYVLRTGFSSSQGALLQMIEYSQQSVSGDSYETGLALLILFIFALIASGYVLKEGLRKKEKTTHEILLKCVIIITSVVPRQFPMQMAMAVNMALMSLMKAGVMCTEPYRVPLAGKVSHCLFDKTGTLTTDTLEPVGVINASNPVYAAAAATTPATTPVTKANGSTSAAAVVGGAVVASGVTGSSASSASIIIPGLTPVVEASRETALVLAACHSLVVVDENANKKSATTEPGEDEPETPSSEAVTTAGAASTGSATAGDQQQPQAEGAGPTLVGDPIELAALKGVEWRWDADSHTALPGNWDTAVKALKVINTAISNAQLIPPGPQRPPQAFFDDMYKKSEALVKKIEAGKEKAENAMFSAVQVVHRHHFSSGLQRMSVVCRCVPQGSYSASEITTDKTKSHAHYSSDEQWYCLVKGSPEALRPLLVAHSAPAWYSATYEALARRGLRVLALAYKKVTAKDLGLSVPSDPLHRDLGPVRDKPRSWVESDLLFGGFIAFECKIRTDSPVVIQALLESDHKVSMLTGDALLTSLHVATEVGICSKNKPSLSLIGSTAPAAKSTKSGKGKPEEVDDVDVGIDGVKGAHWAERREDGSLVRIPLVPDRKAISMLYEKYDLLTTETDFLQAAEESGGDHSPLWEAVEYIQVFARMSPQGKASVIRALQKGTPAADEGTTTTAGNLHAKKTTSSSSSIRDNDVFVLMCGDGGNDVGALKQADVGIALLGGHANTNTSGTPTPAATATDTQTSTSTDGTVTAAAGTDNTAGVSKPSAEEALNAHDDELKKRSAQVNAMRVAHMKDFQAKFTKIQQEWVQSEMQRRSQTGDMMAMWGVMKEGAGRMKAAMDEENRRFMAMHGQVWDPKKDGDAGGIDSLLQGIDSADSGTLPMIRPGDASVAAPFTSRFPSIRTVVDLIRQGRCTLLSALMQQQIMMLESIIAAYTLSALSLHNARSSERQMMASNWLIMTAAVSFSYASPLDRMHPLRPLRSLFHPAIFLSILGQAAIHIACMTLAVQWATDAMGPEKLKEVTEFFKKAKANEIDRVGHCGDDDMMCQFEAYWTAPFMPNLLNSVVFLVETSQMISVFFTNYKGRPWMKGMLENHPLFLSVFVCIAGVVVASWEMVPQLNDLIQLAPFPDDTFRYKVVALVCATIAGTFVWDRLCTLLFARKVFAAMRSEAAKTTFQDILPVFMTAFKIIAVVVILGTGNLILAGLAFFWWRSRSSAAAAAKK